MKRVQQKSTVRGSTARSNAKKKTSGSNADRLPFDARLDPFRNGGWTHENVDAFTEDQLGVIADGMTLIVEAVTFGDFALAHRLLTAIEKMATGQLPPLDQLCKNRGPRYFVEGPGAESISTAKRREA